MFVDQRIEPVSIMQHAKDEFADGWWRLGTAGGRFRTSWSDASQLKALEIPANRQRSRRRNPFITHESAQLLSKVVSEQHF